MDVGAGYRGYTIFHPESFLPRTINFAISTQILGNSIDVLEVNARMEGLEAHANKVLGEKGYLSKDFMKKIFEIPKNIGDGVKSRQRRGIGDDSMWAYINQLHELVCIIRLVCLDARVVSFPLQYISVFSLCFTMFARVFWLLL